MIIGDFMNRYAVFARIAAGVMLIIVWGLTDSPLLGVVFMLLLTALSAARYRFKPYSWLIITEAIICVVYAFLWFPALLGLWLAVISFLENKWREWETELIQNENQNRAELLRLEKKREAAVLDSRNAARVAELTERARIAQDIHDHVGHEISGTLIALRTAVMLYEKGDERAGELLKQTAERLEQASENLRETVHNLKPAEVKESSYSMETLEELCGSFGFCTAVLVASGDLNNVNVWELLVVNLKEALTNVAKHSSATKVDVKLNGNADYIRMTVTDNGKSVNKNMHYGMGLTGMKERVRRAGGTLSFNTESGFQIINVLPKQGGLHEAFDS